MLLSAQFLSSVWNLIKIFLVYEVYCTCLHCQAGLSCTITLFEKSNFCPKIQFWHNPNNFTSFSPKIFLTIFLVKSKLSTAKKAQNHNIFTSFSPKKNQQFSREIKVEFLDKKWRFRTVWQFRQGKAALVFLPLLCLSAFAQSSLTWRTGLVVVYRSRKALADMSYFRQLAKCCRMDSIVCRGCWRVIRRNFCSGLAMLGKIDWAASYGSMGLDGPAIKNDIMRQFFGELLCIALHHYLLVNLSRMTKHSGQKYLKSEKTKTRFHTKNVRF